MSNPTLPQSYRNVSDTVSAHGAATVSKSDTTVIPVTRALYIGVTGDVVVRMADGQTVTFKAAPVGILPIQVDMVMSTSTTATDMLALY